MLKEMMSRLGPNFVEVDLGDGMFGGYMNPGNSRNSVDEVEEVDTLTGMCFVGVGGPEKSTPHNISPPTRQDPPIEHTLKLTLEELFSGCTKKMKITRKVLSGNGSVSMEGKVISVEVKPGWKPGTKVTFPHEGDQAMGRIPSDIAFVIAEKPHPKFRRVGNDLRYTVVITLKTALCGGLVEIPHIDGHVLTHTVQSIVIPNSEDVLRGQGMPVSRQPGKRGDLLVNYSIKFPKKISTPDKIELANILEKY